MCKGEKLVRAVVQRLVHSLHHVGAHHLAQHLALRVFFARKARAKRHAAVFALKLTV